MRIQTDTLKYAKILSKKGFSKNAAEGFFEMLSGLEIRVFPHIETKLAIKSYFIDFTSILLGPLFHKIECITHKMASLSRLSFQ